MLVLPPVNTLQVLSVNRSTCHPKVRPDRGAEPSFFKPSSLYFFIKKRRRKKDWRQTYLPPVRILPPPRKIFVTLNGKIPFQVRQENGSGDSQTGCHVKFFFFTFLVAVFLRILFDLLSRGIHKDVFGKRGVNNLFKYVLSVVKIVKGFPNI